MPPSPEQALLGCCLLDPTCIDKALQAGLRAECFQDKSNEHLWRAIVRLHGEGKALGFEGVYMALSGTGELEKCGGAAHLSAVDTAVVTSAPFQPALEAVLTAHKLRTVRVLAMEIENSVNRGVPWEEVQDTVGRLGEAASDTGIKQPPTVKEVAEAELANFDRIIAGETDNEIKIGTGICDFDRTCGLIRPHEYVIIAARPAMGKTALGTQIIREALNKGLKVVFFSIEMSARQVVLRMASQKCGVSYFGLNHALRSQQQEFRDSLEAISRCDTLRIYDSDFTIEQIESRVRLVHDTFKPDLYVLDYIQLVRTGANEEYQKVTEASNRIMQLCKKTGVAWVCLAQLRRDSEGKEPNLGDLKGSGSLEQDAHRVIFIHRPPRDFSGMDQNTLGETREVYDCYLAQAKLRDGPTGGKRVRFLASKMQFVSAADA